ncbi:hypothetical protein C8R44DRAFT_738815 [Mycena epipterygia]|nr:hypothetical protein C8R44DRAFT_738815 [Mycena epipterygia]
MDSFRQSAAVQVDMYMFEIVADRGACQVRKSGTCLAHDLRASAHRAKAVQIEKPPAYFMILPVFASSSEGGKILGFIYNFADNATASLDSSITSDEWSTHISDEVLARKFPKEETNCPKLSLKDVQRCDVPGVLEKQVRDSTASIGGAEKDPASINRSTCVGRNEMPRRVV